MVTETASHAVRRVALLGNHVPRHCGIATFTSDLSDALAASFPTLDAFVLAMNDPGKRYAYPPRVRLEIEESDLSAYHRAADLLNVNDVSVVSLQHEYGIFGGPSGSHLLALLRDLRMPVVTTLHTILETPNAAQRAVMNDVCALSERLVVMSPVGVDLLRDVHSVDPTKVDVIPHGTPALPTARHSKDTLGVRGHSVLLTFGLLSPDKGIEYVIDALPEIVAEHPDVLYVVLGATHPHVKDRDGETYRLMLMSRAQRLGVDDHLIFHDRFVEHHELVQFLSAADIYLTPYLNAEQITSGTLAYAVGAGKAVISTPYRYARELLADGRGVLVPWKDAGAIAREVLAILGDGGKRDALERRASELGKTMSWPVVAAAYMESFERAAASHRVRGQSFRPSAATKRRVTLPAVNLSHVRTMTDSTGMLQHALWNVPRYEDGYCLDDNARALILVAAAEDACVEPAAAMRPLATRYLAFVRHAFDERRGRFRNFMSYERRWTEAQGSEDSHGRAVWALGTMVHRSTDPGRRALSVSLFHGSIPATTRFTSPRAWAYVLLGAEEYLQARPEDDAVRATRDALAERLYALFHATTRSDWPWFEDRLTYANARLAQALIAAGASMDRADMTEAGLVSLEWLDSVQRNGAGTFAPIGSGGFFPRGGTRAEFDQQPLEACGMVSACLEAYRVTGRTRWRDRARRAFDWFLGENQLACWLYDPATGGCRDGLHPTRANENQGAESTLSFLTALIEVQIADRRIDVLRARAPSPASEADPRRRTELSS